MTYFPIPVEEFGGLNLVDDPGEVGFSGALDLLNVDLDQRGRVRSRDGLTSVKTGFANGLTKVFAWPVNSTSDVVLVTQSVNETQSYKGGVIVSSDVGQGAGSAAHIGVGGAVAAYYAPYGSTIRKVDSAGTISIPAGMPNARFVAVQPTDNRLAAGEISGSLSRVQFSDPGAPETWGVNNYIDLFPDDGETITEMKAWGNLLFVFKRSRFFVFYGNSTDSSGNSIFNYRTVDTGVGCSLSAPTESFGHNAVTGPDGVYFFSNNNRRAGIYKTTGGEPVCISRDLDPLFRPKSDTRAPFFSYSAAAQPDFRNLCMVGGRLHVGIVSGSNYGSLVYDPATGRWVLWSLASSTAAPMFADGLSTTYATNGTTTLYKLDQAATDDDGSAITSRYQSGFESLAPPRRYIDKYGFGPSRKRVRSWRVAGTGTVTMSVAADEGALKGATSLTLGVSPAIAEARYSNAIRGAKISYKLSGVGPWAVNDLVAMLADTRQPGSDVSDG